MTHNSNIRMNILRKCQRNSMSFSCNLQSKSNEVGHSLRCERVTENEELLYVYRFKLNKG